MKLMKTIVLVAFALSMYSTAHARRRGRMQRTAQGVNSGEVTQGESRRIARGERRLQHTRRQANSDDGQVESEERGDIQQQRQRQNRRIFRAKHNSHDSQEGAQGGGDSYGQKPPPPRGQDGDVSQGEEGRDQGRRRRPRRRRHRRPAGQEGGGSEHQGEYAAEN